MISYRLWCGGHRGLSRSCSTRYGPGNETSTTRPATQLEARDRRRKSPSNAFPFGRSLLQPIPLLYIATCSSFPRACGRTLGYNSARIRPISSCAARVCCRHDSLRILSLRVLHCILSSSPHFSRMALLFLSPSRCVTAFTYIKPHRGLLEDRPKERKQWPHLSPFLVCIILPDHLTASYSHRTVNRRTRTCASVFSPSPLVSRRRRGYHTNVVPPVFFSCSPTYLAPRISASTRSWFSTSARLSPVSPILPELTERNPP
jgi:hypothetical protein